MIKFGAYN